MDIDQKETQQIQEKQGLGVDPWEFYDNNVVAIAAGVVGAGLAYEHLPTWLFWTISFLLAFVAGKVLWDQSQQQVEQQVKEQDEKMLSFNEA